MAQVPYLTNLTLYKNIPLSPDYRDTVYFASAQEQQAWFATFSTYAFAFTNQMYQRVTKNSVRLEGNPRQYDGINYMKFQNTFTGGVNRWWYAFVLETEYVNENVFDVIYEIDVMQTFLVGTDYDLLDCYVEREHQATDDIGDNLLKEPVSIGDYVINAVGGTSQNPTYLKEPSASLDGLTYVVAIMPLLDKTPEGSIKITSHPADIFNASVNDVVSYSVTATGDGLTYQWWLKVPNTNDWQPVYDGGDSRYTGSNTSTLTLHGVLATDNVTFYRCVIRDQYGFETESNWASLSVSGS